MDKKVSKESFKAYRDWHRYILNAEPKLSRGLTKSTLVAYCFAMAEKGANGLGCYTSDATIARQLGLYDARAVRPYRHEALRLDWFVWTGEMKGRSQVLDIAIPEDRTDVRPKDDSQQVAAPAERTNVRTKPAEPKPAFDEPEHDADAKSARDCPGCLPMIGLMTAGQIADYHRECLGRLGVSDA